jgi:hypothetical protein
MHMSKEDSRGGGCVEPGSYKKTSTYIWHCNVFDGSSRRCSAFPFPYFFPIRRFTTVSNLLFPYLGWTLDVKMVCTQNKDSFNMPFPLNSSFERPLYSVIQSSTVIPRCPSITAISLMERMSQRGATQAILQQTLQC